MKETIGFIILFSLMIILHSCQQNNNIIWSLKNKDEIFSAQFLLKNEKVIFYSSDGISCNDLSTGNLLWNREDTFLVFPQAYFDDYLLFNSNSSNSLSFINIDTKEYGKLFNSDEKIISTNLIDDELYYITAGNSVSHLRMRKLGSLQKIENGLDNNEEQIIFQFSGELLNPIIIHGNNILLFAGESGSIAKIYCLNKISGDLNWEKEIYFRGLFTENYFISIDKSLFFVDMKKDAKNCLVKIDIVTGKEIKRIKPNDSEWFSYSDYVTSPHIGFDGMNILVHGDKYFVYNIKSGQIKKLDIIADLSIINDGNIIYYNDNSLFIYNLEEESNKEIYKLRGQKLFQIFAKQEYVLLVLAKNIRDDISLGNKLSYVMLKI